MGHRQNEVARERGLEREREKVRQSEKIEEERFRGKIKANLLGTAVYLFG